MVDLPHIWETSAPNPIIPDNMNNLIFLTAQISRLNLHFNAFNRNCAFVVYVSHFRQSEPSMWLLRWRGIRALPRSGCECLHTWTRCQPHGCRQHSHLKCCVWGITGKACGTKHMGVKKKRKDRKVGNKRGEDCGRRISVMPCRRSWRKRPPPRV